MELIHPNEIRLNDESRSLLADVDEAAKRVNDLRPLEPHIVDAVHRELFAERVYASNAIEGSPVDLRETIAILTAGHRATLRRDATEVLNLGRAIEYAQEHLIADLNTHSPEQLLEVHRLLIAGVSDQWAGRYRNESVMIRGAKYQPPDHTHIGPSVERFFEVLKSPTQAHPLVLGAWVHWALARIHPFMDGNGRIARLWQDAVLFNKKLTCALIRPQDRREYYESLQAADDSSFDSLVQFVSQHVLSTFDKYMSAQQQDQAMETWASEVVKEAHAHAAEKRRLAYLRWKRALEAVRYEFQRCAAKLTSAANDIEIQVRPYETIPEEAWGSIGSGIRVGKTWFFMVFFRRDRRYVNYIFFFGKHYWSQLDLDRERADPRVCLLVSEEEGGESAVRLGDEEYSGPITLREVFAVDSDLVRRRVDLASGTDVYDRQITPTQIAQDFMREVLVTRL